jgi:hypothetical protein
MTRVTVAIPTYDRDEYLKEALDSTLSQSISDIEVIVSDNANSARTRALVESYADSRLVYDPLERNIGLHGNQSRCLHLGSAPYVAVLLDDDLMYPRNLETKLALMEKRPSAGLAHSAIRYIDAAGGVLAEHVQWTGSRRPCEFETGREFIQRTMALGNRVCMSSALIRRSAVVGLEHDPRDGGFSDLGLWLKVALRSDFAFVDEPLTAVRMHGASASSAAGLHDLREGGVNLPTLHMTRAARAAKLRFLDEQEIALGRRRSFRRAARDRARTELKAMVAAETLGERSLPLTARSLYRAARVEPSLWWSPWSAVLIASSLFGRRVFDTAVQMRSAQ